MRDLMELGGFIALDSPEAAARFMLRSRETMTWLADMPRAGTFIRSRLPRLSGVRRWPIIDFPNHLMIYREIEDGIEVARVFHGASNWRYRLRRDSKREQFGI